MAVGRVNVGGGMLVAPFDQLLKLDESGEFYEAVKEIVSGDGYIYCNQSPQSSGTDGRLIYKVDPGSLDVVGQTVLSDFKMGDYARANSNLGYGGGYLYCVVGDSSTGYYVFKISVSDMRKVASSSPYSVGSSVGKIVAYGNYIYVLGSSGATFRQFSADTLAVVADETNLHFNNVVGFGEFVYGVGTVYENGSPTPRGVFKVNPNSLDVIDSIEMESARTNGYDILCEDGFIYWVGNGSLNSEISIRKLDANSLSIIAYKDIAFPVSVSMEKTVTQNGYMFMYISMDYYPEPSERRMLVIDIKNLKVITKNMKHEGWLPRDSISAGEGFLFGSVAGTKRLLKFLAKPLYFNKKDREGENK